MTAWDVSTAVFLQLFNVGARENQPEGLFFKPDGFKMYVAGYQNDNINEYDLGTAWDVSTAVFLQLFSLAAQDNTPLGIFFKADGLKMYVAGNQNDSIFEYSLGAAWDVSTLAFVRSFSVAAQEVLPTDVFFKPDGLKMYVLGAEWGITNHVHEYDLGTAWNISTAVYAHSFDVIAQEASPHGMSFKSDGVKMYVCGTVSNNVNEYDLGVAWDVSTAVFLQSFSVAAQEDFADGMFFNPAGTKMYVSGPGNDSVNEYDVDGVVGWTGKISGITNPAEVAGVPVANIASVKGVA